ncbi:MAG: hypothetical protein U0470_02895 [Anaerolineae bacterium]
MSAQLVEGSLAFERGGTTTLRESHGVADVSGTTICAAPPSPAAQPARRRRMRRRRGSFPRAVHRRTPVGCPTCSTGRADLDPAVL